MGGLFDSIGDFFEDLLDSIGKALKGAFDFIMDTIGKFVIDKILTPIMNFLGFTDEDVYLAEIIACKVFNEDLLDSTRKRLHSEYMVNGTGAFKYAQDYSKTGDNQFGQYYRRGKWYYVDYLPTSQLNAISIDTSSILDIISNINKKQVNILDIFLTVPTDDDWCKYQLQEIYDYDLLNDSLKLDDKYYQFDRSIYISSNNTFDAVVKTVTEQNHIKYKATEIQQEIISIEELEPNPTTPDILQDKITYNYITITEERLLVTAVATNYVLEDTGFIETERVIETKEVIVNRGNTIAEGVISRNEELVSDIVITVPLEYLHLNIPSHSHSMIYVVSYIVPFTGKKKLWMYNPKSGYYPQLNAPASKVTNLEMYPVAMLRNDKKDITETKGKRLESTEYLLDGIGIKVEDLVKGYKDNPDIEKVTSAFFMLGVSPSNNKHIVSRVLFEFFDFIYYKMPFTSSNDNTYAASIKENPFNASVVWTPVLATIKPGRFASLGTYQHIRNGSRMTVRGQTEPNQYKEFIVDDFQGINIIREGGYNGGVHLDQNNTNLIVPLSPDIVNRLTLMEKTALLGESAYLIFYAVEHQHIKWYQTSKFANFLKVFSFCLTIVITIASFGSASYAGVAWQSAVLGALKTVAIGAAVTLALKVISSNVAIPWLRAVLSVAVVVAGMAASGVFDDLTWLDATQLCKLPSLAGDIFAGNDLQELQNDVKNFQSQYEQRDKTFQAAFNSINSGLEATDITQIFNLGKASTVNATLITPTQFFDIALGKASDIAMLCEGFYDNNVHKFVQLRKQIGLHEE